MINKTVLLTNKQAIYRVIPIEMTEDGVRGYFGLPGKGFEWVHNEKNELSIGLFFWDEISKIEIEEQK